MSTDSTQEMKSYQVMCTTTKATMAECHSNLEKGVEGKTESD
jgi:hypothetical protein